MKAVVVTFPGSNCDQDAVHALASLGAEVSSVWHKEAALPPSTDLVVLPGGFSYGDALRSGAIARFSPVMGAVRAHAERGGLVLGICNGFQVLVESHLLPGAMLRNASGTFICRPVSLEVATRDTPFTRSARPGPLRIPVAHHEGRYFADEETLKQLEAEGRIAFRYLDNPNGSVQDIAGILSANRRILGMMPHPERAADPVLGGDHGQDVFKSLLEAEG